MSGGSGETGKNTISHEHDGDTPPADRGTLPFDEETLGTDTATFDPIHAPENKDKTKGSAAIYGYEDYTGVTFHPSKNPNALTHVIKSITGSTEGKPKEYCPPESVKSNTANVGIITISGKPLTEPTYANYLTFDVAVPVTKRVGGMAAYMGDPKTDIIFTDDKATDTVCPLESGKYGAPVSPVDLINVECFGPIVLERSAGGLPLNSPR